MLGAKDLSDTTIIRTLKIVMSIGIVFILLGVYFHMFNETIEEMGVTGILISAIFVALGMIMSLPTKMFLTFVLVNREQELAEKDAVHEGRAQKD
ncbi:hypothetical protein PN836_009675 [Ningiella sp. W23]|uniref:hypothetical protein n=1 Tax=Ningiella sp. W23 TaxID=3023715 RepID=UPI003756EE83